MATTQEVETSVTVNDRPFLDYDQTDDHAQPTYKDSSDDNNDNEIDDEEILTVFNMMTTWHGCV